MELLSASTLCKSGKAQYVIGIHPPLFRYLRVVLSSWFVRAMPYSYAPMRSIPTSFSVRNRQSPRRRFFFVRPANCTRSSFITL